MSLATRCTTCGTVFRVVQDQLKVSEGWVRCGRCSAVFNALQGLFDLERGTPPDGSPNPNSESPDVAPADVAAPPAEVAASAAPAQPLVVEPVQAPAIHTRDSDQLSTPAGRVSERDRLEFPDAQFDPNMLAEDAVHVQAPPAELESASLARAGDAAGSEDAPAFVLHAQQRARWHSTPMRALQGAVLLLLVLVLALQGAHHHRNLIAARWTSMAPALTAWCRLLACRLEAPDRIADVAVESTALTRAAMPETFRLALVLRNRGPTDVALPAIDLTLTDAGGQLVARRVLSPRDFRAASTVMRPGTESSLQVLLGTGSARVTGYTVEVFYP